MVHIICKTNIRKTEKAIFDIRKKENSKVIKIKVYEFFAWRRYVRLILDVCLSEILKLQCGRVRRRKILRN